MWHEVILCKKRKETMNRICFVVAMLGAVMLLGCKSKEVATVYAKTDSVAEVRHESVSVEQVLLSDSVWHVRSVSIDSIVVEMRMDSTGKPAGRRIRIAGMRSDVKSACGWDLRMERSDSTNASSTLRRDVSYADERQSLTEVDPFPPVSRWALLVVLLFGIALWRLLH